MNRKDWIKQTGLAATTALTFPFSLKKEETSSPQQVLKIAHITDVHIRPEDGIPERFKKCLKEIEHHQVDFFLNGGDTIHAADYDDITRERMLEQWKVWDNCREEIGSYDLYSCLGNHDMWWAAPDKTDPMYGKRYVTERLQLPGRYYSFSKKGWHFIILDSNNSGVSLDSKQLAWLEKELGSLPEEIPVLVMSHCPIITVTGRFYPSDQHSDAEKLTELFYKYKNNVKVCISGHMHLLDHAVYNEVQYFCNGAVSGYWWGEGNEQSAGTGYYHQTPPGFAILKLYDNGYTEREYYAHTH